MDAEKERSLKFLLDNEISYREALDKGDNLTAYGKGFLDAIYKVNQEIFGYRTNRRKGADRRQASNL
jgi:hypothetical protein